MSLTAVALIGSGVLLAAWYAVVLGYAAATRPRELRPGPPTMELGAEPPAVVNLLVTRCRLTADAADATLLDLAARRILELHQPGDDPADLLVRVRVPAPELRPFERRVFDRVAALAGPRLVPLRQVVDGYAEGGPNWLRHLRAEVVAEAQSRGLVKARRIGSPIVLLSLLTGMAVSCLGILPLQRTGQSTGAHAVVAATVLGWFCAAPLVSLFLMLLAVPHLSGARHTEAGRLAGGYWLGVAAWLAAHEDNADLPPAAVAIWDRYLSYGVALGVNPLAARSLDLAVGHRGWFSSQYGGRPRTVEVRYPYSPFRYTQAGVVAVWSGLLLTGFAAFWLLVAPAIRGWPPAARWPLYGVAAALTLRAGYRLARGLAAKLNPLEFTAQVLAAHLWRPRPDNTFGWIQLVLDDGRHDRTRLWLVRADRGTGVHSGDVIRVRAQPWTRYVFALERLDAAAAARRAVTPPGSRAAGRPPGAASGPR